MHGCGGVRAKGGDFHLCARRLRGREVGESSKKDPLPNEGKRNEKSAASSFPHRHLEYLRSWYDARLVLLRPKVHALESSGMRKDLRSS